MNYQNQNQNQALSQSQNPNRIKNPKTQVPETPQMNDRDFANDMLATGKYMTDSYSTVLNEASHESLYQDLSMIFKETQDCQRNFYNLMFKKGWYSIEAAPQQKLQQDYQQFQGYSTQFPYNNNTMQ
ncbi:spore coat protein [Calidifontibacillus oryziterrae]|uniref:spore coat protein n=1 Tax=Calidifontibacillus oryziterrae TaxID=1191699 RepID=UPI00030AC5A3|nr:spore coat protein [Calidifontibacillus oryziterrae]